MANNIEDKSFAFLKYLKQENKKIEKRNWEKKEDYTIGLADVFAIIVFLILSAKFLDTRAFIGCIIIITLTLLILKIDFKHKSITIKNIIIRSNFKIDLNNKVISIENYPVIEYAEHPGKYVLGDRSVDLAIYRIDSIQKYDKYYVITVNSFFEFLLPITAETEAIVNDYNNMFDNEIGKKIQITEFDSPQKFIMNGEIIATHAIFDGYFHRRIFIVKTENDFIINDKNYGKILVILNRLAGHNLIGDRNIHIGILHSEYNKSEPINMTDSEPIVLGNLKFI